MAEALERPEFIIDTFTSESDRLALEALERAILENPAFAERGLDLYRAAPEAVGDVVQFLQEHPEGGLHILDMWNRVIARNLDIEVEMDQATEEAVNSDPTYTKAVTEFRTSSQEEKRTEFRMRRLRIFIKRALDTAA